MIYTRHEEYNNSINGLPFVLNIGITLTPSTCSNAQNWHDNPEIQFCTKGHGEVLLNGKKYKFNKNDIIIANSNVIHYTTTDEYITYSCLIISAKFFKIFGIDYNSLEFSPFIQNPSLFSLLKKMIKIYTDDTVSFRAAKLNEILLHILIELSENYSKSKTIIKSKNKTLETVKSIIIFIRKNYNRKITLDEISKIVFTDKYTICREFKKLTGQTIVEYLNRYRCIKATDYLNEEYSVAQTSALCGFENLSYFTKTFKKYIGELPSDYKKH